MTTSPEVSRKVRDEGYRWHVVQTHPHKEAASETRLAAQGYQTFLPLQNKTIRHARRILTAQRPVFPQYLFVRFVRGQTRWRPINGTMGVRHLIMNGDEPAPVARGVVESLIASTGDDGILQFRQPLKPGDTVRLLSGPFAGQLGVLEMLKPEDRVRLLMSFIGGAVRVEVDRSALTLAR